MPTMRYNKNIMTVEDKLTMDTPLHVPPPEVWRFTPGKDEPLPTPMDERGLVDVDRLIGLVQSTIEPEFSWESSARPDAHHLYWEHNRYPGKPDESINPEEFCNLSINQVIVPRMFHNWLHMVTEEPPVPSKESMHYRIEAHNVVRKLLRNARQSLALAKAPNYTPVDKIRRGYEYHLWQFLIEAEEAQKLPTEFQIVNFSELNPSTPDELHELASFLGRSIARSNRARSIRKGLALSSLQAASGKLVA